MNTIKEVKGKLKKSFDELTIVCHENDYDKDEWLRLLYSSYLKRMLSENERIWKTGSIFIPLSLLAFAFLVAIEVLVWWNIILLGIFSSVVIKVGNIIEDNQRGFQQKSEAWLMALQEEIGIYDDTGQIILEGSDNSKNIQLSKLKKMRYFLSNGIPVAWLVILILHLFKII